MKLEFDFKNKFRNDLSKNVKLSNYSWFNLGGYAEYFYKPKDIDQLKDFLKYVKDSNIKITVLGAGSNTLIRDKGIKGAVIKLGKNFSYIKKIDKNILEVGSYTRSKSC